ncbi:deoxynucleotide monophosphate kinase family protein [Enteractinococcus helveticum]|uniref:Deoxynucleoside monophosphate kinase n=1 Tax=Enteractinococcus helveticum TaxID=1837282 RepID=A0A1B7M2P1_9MICC|nr:hypothetical protein [Enteractinococcus helveticum]OAV62841.1 hypothetical protein A6F49_04865 [Enteractinococcus helveticum]
MAQLIGLTGLKRSGKDATAYRLTSRHGYVRIAFAEPVKGILADLNPYVDPPSQSHRGPQMYEEIGVLEQRLVTTFRNRAVMPMPSSKVAMAIRCLDPLMAGDQRLKDVLNAVDGDWDRLKEGSEDTSEQVVAEIRRLQQMLGTEVARNMVSPTIWVDTAMQCTAALGRANVPVVISDVRFDNEAQAIRDAAGVVVEIHRPNLLHHTVDGHASERGVESQLIDHTIVNDGALEDLHREVDQLIDRVSA